jgi:S1-C subfamily serine protease
VPPGADEIKVVFYGPTVRDAKIVEADEKLEATLLKVDAQDLEFFPIARDVPAVGEPAYTFGNAHQVMSFGGRAFFSEGIISGVYEVADLGGESMYAGPAIETTAAINQGSDGGPIVNSRGQLCAIVSLNVSLQRWQGVGVPTSELLKRLRALSDDKLGVTHDPLFEQPQAETPLSEHAKKVAEYLVGIAVERQYPPEVLPRVPWEQYRGEIEGWDQKELDEKRERIGTFFGMGRLFEVNQQLRRPAGPVTGVIISPDGFVLTSGFNVGVDVVFTNPKTRKVRPIDPKAMLNGLSQPNPKSLEELIRGVNQGLIPAKNPVKRIQVTLANGQTRDAKLVGQHVSLGLALLKIDGKDTELPYFDIAQATATPRVGEPVGLVGHMGGSLTPYTLNTGIVSAPSREQGYQFQTDALLNYGNSGGPVISASGQLLGIAGAPLRGGPVLPGSGDRRGLDGAAIRPRTVIGRFLWGRELLMWQVGPNSGVGTACRADRFDEFLGDLKSGKTIETFLWPLPGVVIDPNRAYDTQVVVGNVVPRSAAEKAGLKRGDRIEAIDGKGVSSWQELTQRLQERQPGDKVKLKIGRTSVERHLLINGEKVASEASLRKLMGKLKPGEKFAGQMIQSDKLENKVITIVLGGTAP